MTRLTQPSMSVVLVTPDESSTLDRTLEALSAQSAVEQLEVVIVAPRRESGDFAEQLKSRFAAVRVTEIGDIKRMAVALAAGVQAATAPVVVFGEDHAFPEPGWADALLAAHRGPWAAVGPAMRNANPETLTSWADFLLGYGRWRTPVAAGPTDRLPGHNSSYKRTALLGYGRELVDWLQAPALMHDDLAARGMRLYLEPAAIVAHTNFADTRLWFQVRFHAGRTFAAARARHWTIGRRVAFALATPLVPFARLARIGWESRRPGPAQIAFLKVAPLLFCGLAIDATGELAGYLRGVPRDGYDREWEWEFHRGRFQ